MKSPIGPEREKGTLPSDFVTMLSLMERKGSLGDLPRRMGGVCRRAKTFTKVSRGQGLYRAIRSGTRNPDRGPGRDWKHFLTRSILPVPDKFGFTDQGVEGILLCSSGVGLEEARQKWKSKKLLKASWCPHRTTLL